MQLRSWGSTAPGPTLGLCFPYPSHRYWAVFSLQPLTPSPYRHPPTKDPTSPLTHQTPISRKLLPKLGLLAFTYARNQGIKLSWGGGIHCGRDCSSAGRGQVVKIGSQGMGESLPIPLSPPTDHVRPPDPTNPPGHHQPP